MRSQEEQDTRLAQLEAELADVQRRLRALESARPAEIFMAPAADSMAAETPLEQQSIDAGTSPPSDITGLATLLGRTFMVFGGAYLLRALTDSGRLPGTAGVIIGLAYAMAWLVAAGRAPATKSISAQFHGVTALLVGLPIVWEATVRFGLMAPGTAACVLAVMSAAALAVSWRGRLDTLAAMASFGTIATAFVTAWSTNHFGAFSLLLIGQGTAIYWFSEQPGHAWLRWPSAIAAGLSVVGVTSRALASPPLEPLWLTFLGQGVLLATMQGSLAVRLLILGRNARFFDIMQAASGLVIGVGGAVLLARGSTPGLGLIGAVTAILASGAYLAAFLRLADRPHLAKSYHLCATFGLASAVMALVLLCSGQALTLTALTVGVVIIGLGRPRLAGYAPLHASAFVLTALAASNLLSASLAVWTTIPSPWPAMSAIEWMTLAVAGVCATMRPSIRQGLGDLLARSGRWVLASLFVFAASGALLMLLAPLVAGLPADAGVLATLRTALLSSVVVALGAVSRWPKAAAFGRLVYPVLIVGGLRLLADDFPHSRPGTLFIALALYGLAWVLGPRLAARFRA